MKIQSYLFALAVVATASLVSCSSDNNDTQKPIVNLHAPEEGAHLEAGKSIHFDMEVSDNEMLGSYKIDIHSAEGHSHTHSHGKMAKLVPMASETILYNFQHQWSLAGQRNASIHHHEITIPENATPGDYHFVVYVLDAAGNQEMVARNIEIVGPGEGDHDHDHDHEGEEYSH